MEPVCKGGKKHSFLKENSQKMASFTLQDFKIELSVNKSSKMES